MCEFPCHVDHRPKSNSEGEESSSMEMTENGHLMREELEEHPLVGRMTILQDRISELAASEALLQMKIEELKVGRWTKSAEIGLEGCGRGGPNTSCQFLEFMCEV